MRILVIVLIVVAITVVIFRDKIKALLKQGVQDASDAANNKIDSASTSLDDVIHRATNSAPAKNLLQQVADIQSQLPPEAIQAAKKIGDDVLKAVLGAGGSTAAATAAGGAAEAGASAALAGGATVEEAAAIGGQAAVSGAGSTAAAGAAGGSAGAGAGTGSAVVAGETAIGVQVAAAAIPLAIVLWVAKAWGVFDSWDPHAGQQLFTLSRDVIWIKAKAGDKVWIPNSIFDQIKNSPDGPAAVMLLDSYFNKMAYQIEAEQAQKQQVQRAQDSVQAAQDAQALADQQAEAARQAAAEAQQQIAIAQQARDEQARIDAQNALIAAQAQAAAAAQAQREADAAAALAAQANSQAVKQATAAKVYGDPGRQYNFNGFPARRVNGSPFQSAVPRTNPFVTAGKKKTRRLIPQI